jgi:hypothetical protein
MVGGEKDITRVYLERMLTPDGIKAGEYDLLYAGSTLARFAALQSGAVSAAILFPPLNFRAEAAGFTNLGFVVDYARNLLFSGISVNTSWATRNKERLEKFLAAYTKAVVWLNDGNNRSEAVRILVEASRQSPEDTEKSYDMYRKIDFFETKGEVSKKKVAEIIDILRSDMRDKPLDINRLFLPNVTRVIDAIPSVGSSLRMVGTACLSSPRIAFSHDRFAVGLVISASIFTMCSRLSSRTRLLPCLARNFSMMRRRALRVSSAKLVHSAHL